MWIVIIFLNKENRLGFTSFLWGSINELTPIEDWRGFWSWTNYFINLQKTSLVDWAVHWTQPSMALSRAIKHMEFIFTAHGICIVYSGTLFLALSPASCIIITKQSTFPSFSFQIIKWKIIALFMESLQETRSRKLLLKLLNSLQSYNIISLFHFFFSRLSQGVVCSHDFSFLLLFLLNPHSNDPT